MTKFMNATGIEYDINSDRFKCKICGASHLHSWDIEHEIDCPLRNALLFRVIDGEKVG